MKESCSQIEPLLAGYALDALETGEITLVEKHLADCPDCLRALADYQSVSDALLASHPPREPRAKLRKQLLHAISSNPKKTVWRRSFWHWLQSNHMPAIALAGVFVLALINISLLRSTRLLLEQQTLHAHQLQAYQTALNIAVSPDTRVAALEGQGVSGSLIFDQEDTTAVLNVSGLEDLPPDQTYQVWLIRPDESRVSGGTFNAEDGFTILVIHSPDKLDAFRGFGVTIEPAGGSQGPTGPRVLAGKL